MGQPGRPKPPLVVSADDRTELARMAKRGRINRNLAFRARLVLACADESSNTLVARANRTTNQTVGKWRQRYVDGGIAALYDEPRVGAPRTIADDKVEDVVVQTLETKPRGRTHWSTRKMAQTAGLSHSTIGRIWRTFGLKPHVSRSFKLSDDPQFVAKVRDVVGLYMSPPENAVVLAVDEKSQVQALERAQPILPLDLGQPERQTQNYVRHGTLDLFAALDVVSGKVIARCTKQHRAKEFVEFLRQIDQNVPSHLEVHVVLDNLSTHKTPAVHRWMLKHPRFHLHFTPTYASWLNLVERFFGLLTEHALRRGSHQNTTQLRAAIMEYVEAHNDGGKPFKWTKTADEILESVRRFATRTLAVHSG